MYIRMHKAFYNNSSITMKQAPKQSNKVAIHLNKLTGTYVHVQISVLMIMADYQLFSIIFTISDIFMACDIPYQI